MGENDLVFILREMDSDYIIVVRDIEKNLSYKYPISIADVMKMAEIARDEILEWVEKKRIPKKIYNEISKEGQPLPRRLYVDQKKGEFWSQLHWRGIEPEQYKLVRSGKLELWEALVGNSYHLDIRCDFAGLPRLVQAVITEENIQDLIKTLKGERRMTAGGMNVSHSMAVSKPSGEPPETAKRFAEPKKIPAVDEEGAKIAIKLDLKSSSYWIEPNRVGSTKNTYSYMMHICSGKIIEGVIRDDLKEWFFYKEKAKDDILDGKFVIKGLKRPDRTARFEFWKAISEPKPMDSIMHSCCDSHWLIPIETVRGFDREYYRKESQRLFGSKLR